MTLRAVVPGLGVLALVAAGAVAASAETVRVGAQPAAVRERANERATVVATVPAGTELEAFDRSRDWLWVVVPAGAELPRTGWISQQSLAAPPAAGTVAAAVASPNPEGESNANGSIQERSGSTASTGVSWSIAAEAEPVVQAAAMPATVAIEPVRRLSLAEAAAAAREASAAAAAKRVANASSTSAGSVPPDPVGGLPGEGRSAFGDWVLPRALRANFGFNYQSALVSQALGAMDERQRGGVIGVATAFAVLDPRILTIDFAGELQLNVATSRAPLASFRNRNGLTSYRVDFGILSGLKAPLRIFADRISSNSDLAPSGVTLDPARNTRGVRRSVGFTWDVNVDRLPRVQLSASTGRQHDERNYLFGYSSTNDERRAEIRASRDHSRVRYDVNFAHSDVAYAVPAAGVRSETGNDLLQATGRFTPSSRLEVDLHARASRFQFGVGGRDSQVSGVGVEGAARYRVREHLTASARYSYSNNAFEAALSGQLAPSQPGATPVTQAVQLQERTRFHDGEGRLEHSTERLTLAGFTKSVSFGVPEYLSPTLSAINTGGGLARVERTWRAVTWHVGADGSAGVARSNRASQEPYRELGAEAGVNWNAGLLRLGADGSVRKIGRLTFFPVNLDSRNANLRAETMRPGWARLRATVTRFDNLRDVLYSDSRDRHTGYSVGLAGGRYDVSLQVDQTDTHSLLLAPAILGSRPDVAILVASRPEMFHNLLAAGDHGSVLALQVRPLAGLHVEVRGRRQEQVYPGLFAVQLNGAQAWATYQIRDVQLEFGWEYFDSSTSFGNVRDRRLYVRVRRDVTFF